jgi:hypothetical protein
MQHNDTQHEDIQHNKYSAWQHLAYQLINHEAHNNGRVLTRLDVVLSVKYAECRK